VLKAGAPLEVAYALAAVSLARWMLILTGRVAYLLGANFFLWVSSCGRDHVRARSSQPWAADHAAYRRQALLGAKSRPGAATAAHVFVCTDRHANGELRCGFLTARRPRNTTSLPAEVKSGVGFLQERCWSRR
jgi:hypothetical protein